ncbi:hypothetical protein [Streptomyces sp. NPDC001787]|uniref:hypothetical protein n=1 Tax=Streptomyces sp. NPDC001787 TaxID=3154523 RepID=UPI003325D416
MTDTPCSTNLCTAHPALLEPLPLCTGCAITVSLALVPRLLAESLGRAQAAQREREHEHEHDAQPPARPGRAPRGPAATAGPPAPSNGVARRSDEELIAEIRAMPTDADGYLPPNRVREKFGCRHQRAARLMRLAGVLRPQDDPELTLTP